MSYLDSSDHADQVAYRSEEEHFPPTVTGRHRYGDGVSTYPLYGSASPGTRDGVGLHDDRDSWPAGDDRDSWPAGDDRDSWPAGDDRDSWPAGDDRDSWPAGDDRDDWPAGFVPVPYPSVAPRSTVSPPVANGRAGRNLPAAVAVGVVLGAAVLASLFLWRPAFLGVVVAAVGVGTWELVRAVRPTGADPPLVPLLAGGIVMCGLAWWGEVDALTFGLVVTVLAAMVWRFSDGVGGYGRDVIAATLIAVYVPFLAGFAALLARPADGDLRVLAMLAGVVLSDTGGYVAGVFFGRHPMAPSVSPKKSWEGFAGSLGAAAIGGSLMLFFMFDSSLWRGAVFGLGVAAAAVLGDLGESLLKRDLGVKDMSNLLPGHGGVMDRLDSMVFAAPTSYLLLLLLVPGG